MVLYGPTKILYGPYQILYGSYRILYGPYRIPYSIYKNLFGPHGISYGPCRILYAPTFKNLSLLISASQCVRRPQNRSERSRARWRTVCLLCTRLCFYMFWVFLRIYFCFQTTITNRSTLLLDNIWNLINKFKTQKMIENRDPSVVDFPTVRTSDTL